MAKARPKKNISPKKITRFTGETKMTKENKEALKVIRAFKGMFG
ncbi:hypothetical protein [Halalkalibacter oceani]|nr:hypothetical protein [Halalkalibacter oceani]